MTHKNNINVLCHFSILHDIVLIGSVKKMYFICIITKLPEEFKKTRYIQSEASIYIKDNDNTYYSIQVSLISDYNKFKKPLNQWILELLERYVKQVYTNIKNDSSKIATKKEKFSYNLYHIPPYIWCIATGMISTEL